MKSWKGTKTRKRLAEIEAWLASPAGAAQRAKEESRKMRNKVWTVKAMDRRDGR